MRLNIFRLAARTSLFGLALLLPIFAPAKPASAQEDSETIRVNTRVVFMEALVKDKRTGVPISELGPENFEVFDEGRPRPISYFTRAGEARRPLALVLVLDLREDGAGRFLRRPEILETMAAELAKLPPEDEVAVVAISFDKDKGRKMLTDFTRDRNQIAAALNQVPALMVSADEKSRATKASEKDAPASKTSEPGHDVSSVETYKDPKTGATVTRTVKRDGTVATTRKRGNVEIRIEDEYGLYAAAREVSRIATLQRPNSKAAIVWVTDGIIPIVLEDRNVTADILVRSNVTFNSLTVSMRTLYKFLLPFAKPVGNWVGVSISGTAKFLAQQSGGEAVQVNRTSDYGRGLSKVIGNLTARYSLGFTLAEEEKDDGRMHKLEIRVKAPDAEGKLRKLEVNSRRGYYMTTGTEKEASIPTGTVSITPSQ